MNEDLITTLQNYGFSEKEAKIYLTLLSLGSAPASTVARTVNESRTTVYSVLGDLRKEGYCSVEVRGNVTYFSAISPEILVKLQEQKYKTLQEKLPEFMAIGNNFWGHSKIKTFEGKNALKNLFMELATTEVDVKSFQGDVELEDYPDIYPKEELKIYWSEKTRKGISTYRIFLNSRGYNQEEESKKDELINQDKLRKYKRHTLVLQPQGFYTKSSIHIFGPNKVSFLFFENKCPYVLIVENEFIYNHLKSLFDYMREHESLKSK